MLPTKFNFPAVYNPANQTRSELVANFVVRLKEYDTIFDRIKRDKMITPAQHYIVQGVRGTGKTTLLLRLAYAIMDSKRLSKWLIPVIFDEEQYSIRTLFKFWEEVTLYLEDERPEMFTGLYDEMQKYIDYSDYEERCYNLLQKRLDDTKKKLVLLIDNFGDMMSKFKRKERQRLREVLIQCNNMRIVGASSLVLEFNYDYSEPFFEFFKVLWLEGLNQEETTRLLLQLSKTYNLKVVKDIVKNTPGRIEALRRLTGGVPRTIILLFEIFLDNEIGSAFEDLELILDRVTPLYKHRMDSLPPQKQEIVDTIALSWDAVGVKEIARKTRIPGKSVSAQLNELEKNRIVIKIPTSTKNNLYQIEERFFNIWYLMRYGRKRDRNKVLWLVRFLESWCSDEELLDRAFKHLEALKSGRLWDRYALYMTEALKNTKIPPNVQYELNEGTQMYISQSKPPYGAEPSKSDKQLLKEAQKDFSEKRFDIAMEKLLKIVNKNSETNLYIAASYLARKNNYPEALRFAKAAFEENQDIIYTHFYSIALILNDKFEDAVSIFERFFEKAKFEDFLYTYSFLSFTDVILSMLMAKKQYRLVFNLFNENRCEIKERLKPIYYALMYFMRDEYPDEYKKMGPELKQTVEEIIASINQMASDYA